jgi:tetratricopeptide (TPR) repeat protein
MNVFEVQPNCTYESCALAHYNLGRIYEAQSEVKTALDHYNRAYLYGSQYAKMYLDLAKAYENNGMLEAAIASYSKYVQLAGADADPMAQSRLDALGVSG